MTVDIRVGDCRQLLAAMPSGSVSTCVTSPPYFGLRDYGVEGQCGLEQTPEEFTENLVRVFREVRRVLRDDGTLWLNLGDSYAGSGKGAWANKTAQKESYVPDPDSPQIRMPKTFEGVKAKNLIGIPWRVAFALQADGWFLRQDIIWQKPNAMPESTADRCTKAHEYIFLFSKQPKYYFDGAAIREPAIGEPSGNSFRKSRPSQRALQRGDQCGGVPWAGGELRNKRSVWTVATRVFREAHFATFPPELIEPCVLAGCPKGGLVLDPFGGAGTTGLVAERLGRNSVLLELNPAYAEMARARIAADTKTPSPRLTGSKRSGNKLPVLSTENQMSKFTLTIEVNSLEELAKLTVALKGASVAVTGGGAATPNPTAPSAPTTASPAPAPAQAPTPATAPSPSEPQPGLDYNAVLTAYKGAMQTKKAAGVTAVNAQFGINGPLAVKDKPELWPAYIAALNA